MGQNKKYFKLDFENEDNNSKFFNLIKKEYINHLFRVIVWIIILLMIYIIYNTLSYQFIKTEIRVFLNQIIAGIIFFAFLLIHFFQLSSFKFAPSILNFLHRELKNLDFEFQRKYKTELGFFLFSSFTIFVFILLNLAITFSTDYSISSLFVRFIIVFILSSTIIPIVRGVFHDKFIVRLKYPYFIQIDLQFKLMKHIEAEAQMVRIFMSSNKLGLKSNHNEFNLYKTISEKRWLPKKSKHFFPVFQLSKTLYFKEYSTPINFKEHFLNIVSAIREWDIENIRSHQNSREP